MVGSLTGAVAFLKVTEACNDAKVDLLHFFVTV